MLKVIIRKKIHDVIEYDLLRLYKEGKDNNHVVKVFLNQNINTLGLILTDDYAMVSIYRVSSGKTTVPHFIYEANGHEYEEVKNDIDRLIDEKNDNVKPENIEEYVKMKTVGDK